MPNLVVPIIFVVLLLLLLWLTWKSPRSTEKLRESLFRNVGVPYRNMIGLVLGATASMLPLVSGTWTVRSAVWAFILILGSMMFLLIVVRPNIERESDRFAWGLLVIIILGFGIGTLIYVARTWWIWLWQQYLRINTPAELLLEALFLLGVILGFFVVRNWAKEQKDFLTSLSGVLGGAFVATILGEIQTELTAMRAFAYYALGFTLSGSLNLIAAARLSANYSNKKTITSRALLDFLYGSERVKTIDGYFLKNFEEDPNYARRFLTDTFLQYRNLISREFAERMDQRREDRRLTQAEEEEQEPKCASLKRKMAEEKLLKAELKAMPAKPKGNQVERKEEIETRLNELAESIQEKESQLERPSFYYQLFGIESDPKRTAEEDSPSQIQDLDREYDVVYKRIDNKSRITDAMFRVSVAIRRADALEYIIAPGQYQGSFPYSASVAGLSLMVRQTIIMDRDRVKQFRSKEFRDGICPRDIEQWRGLDEIDFLSYIAIPVVSRLGSATENALGVVNIDTKLFVTHCELNGQPVKAGDGIFRTRLTPRQLTEFAANLYEQDDQHVKYIEDLTRMIVSVMELYAKCRVGT